MCPSTAGAARDEIHAEVLAKSYDAERNTFVQYYGGSGLDASLLLIPISGFLPADVRASWARSTRSSRRSARAVCLALPTEDGVDGLAGGEGHFSSAASGW